MEIVNEAINATSIFNKFFGVIILFWVIGFSVGAAIALFRQQ